MVLKSRDNKGRIREEGTHLDRYIKSFKHALDGIVYVIKNEHNVIIILLAILLTTISGILFKLSTFEWISVILCFGSVLACEMINTAIEAVVDLETNRINPLAKLAKDTASSATLIFSFTSLIIGLIIFIPKIGSAL